MYGFHRKYPKCPPGLVNGYIAPSPFFLVCIERHLYIKLFSAVLDVDVSHLDRDKQEHPLMGDFPSYMVGKQSE